METKRKLATAIDEYEVGDWFDDESLSTPEHDTMLLELLDEATLMEKIPAALEMKNDVKVELDSELFCFLEGAAGMLRAGVAINDDNVNEVIRRYEEYNRAKCKNYPCKKYRSYTEEDVKAEWAKLVSRLNKAMDTMMAPKILGEVPISTETGLIIGYWDVVVEFKSRVCVGDVTLTRPVQEIRTHRYGAVIIDENPPLKICIEIKPTIDSFGKVIRQLNTYRNYRDKNNSRVVLYTREHRFDAAFKSQGIEVVSP